MKAYVVIEEELESPSTIIAIRFSKEEAEKIRVDYQKKNGNEWCGYEVQEHEVI